MNDTAALIIRALSGHHLHGFLPGQDRRAAIARMIASRHGWHHPDGGFGQVGRDGIGYWATPYTANPRRPNAVLFVAWDELLAVIERGCAGGRRQAYEAAWREWNAGTSRPGADPAGIRAATAALIRHGCEQRAVQEPLF